MKICVVKTMSGFLKPAYDSDHLSFQKMPVNETFEIEYTKGRNIMFHRKFMALLNLAFQNQSDYRVFDTMRKHLTIAAGYYTESRNMITGSIETEAKSISFSNMDELEFNNVYNDVKEVICKWIGISNEEVVDNIEQYF